MILEFEGPGGSRTVEVRPTRDRWEVTIDGHTFVAEVSTIRGGLSLLLPSAAGGPAGSYDVGLESLPGGRLIVHVDGERVPVSLASSLRRAAARQGGPTGGGRGPLVAPMPGRIVRVLVTPGQQVAPRQGLVVMEAMKMENELRAPRPATVREVLVTEGMSVEANAVLLMLDEADTGAQD